MIHSQTKPHNHRPPSQAATSTGRARSMRRKASATKATNRAAATSGGPKIKAAEADGSIRFHSHRSPGTPRGKVPHHAPQTTASAGAISESQNMKRRSAAPGFITRPRNCREPREVYSPKIGHAECRPDIASYCEWPHKSGNNETHGRTASRGLAILADPLRYHPADDTISGRISQSNRSSSAQSTVCESAPANPASEPAYSRRASNSDPPAGP